MGAVSGFAPEEKKQMLSETVRRKYVIAVLLLVLAAALLASGCESDFMGGYNSLINQTSIYALHLIQT